MVLNHRAGVGPPRTRVTVSAFQSEVPKPRTSLPPIHQAVFAQMFEEYALVSEYEDETVRDREPSSWQSSRRRSGFPASLRYPPQKGKIAALGAAPTAR